MQSGMQHKNLTFEISDKVATITLNRPAMANSIDLLTGRELMDVAINCDEDPRVRAVVITGSGPMFCAGGDVKAFSSVGDRIPALLKELTTYLHAATSRFARMDAPVIAAVNGTAAGAGMSLVCACDFAIAADNAKFTMAYTGIGFTPDGSSTYYLPRLIGTRRTLDLMLSNRVLSAEEAREWGIVNEVSAPEEVEDKARALAEKLAQGPTAAYGRVKRMLLSSLGETLETQMEFESRAIAESAGSPDGREGIEAFLEKRKAEFKGI